MTDDATGLARQALDVAPSDPERAVMLAEHALAVAGESGDRAAEAIAWRALGLVAVYANDLRSAVDRFRRAIAVADAHGLAELAGEARTSLAPTLALRGDPESALAECDRAAAVLRGLPRARLEAQRAIVLEYLGLADEALGAYGRALSVFRNEGDRLWEGRARHNRGILHLKRGDVTKARADLRKADQAFQALRLSEHSVHARHHIGKIEALAGNLPTALAWFSRADELLARLGTTDPLGLIDRCSALLPARLGEEAKTAAANAVSELKGGGNEHDLAEARLAYAEACLLTSDPAAASEAAGLAAASFRRRRVYRWAALAGFVALQARWADGDRSSDLLEASRRAAAQLERAGWIDAAAEARLLAGQLAMDLGRREVARRELRRAARRRGSQTAPARARAWQAEALLRLLDGHQGGARSAVRAGLRVVETHRATLGATELRARATGHGADLALLGLRMALEDGSAADVLGWAERWRAGTLHMAPGRPAGDTRLTRDLAELRRLAAEIESATLAGTDVAALRRRQGELEAAVNGRVRLVRGRGEATVTHPPSASGLAGALGDRVLVEMVELDGVLHAVVVGGRQRRRTNLVTLGANADVRAELDSVRFSLRRLARGRGSPAALGAARTALAHAANRLDELLVEPVRPMLGDRPLVLVPTGALHALPWSVLPTLSGRPVTVAPSAAMWLRADTATPKGNDTRFVLVAGPRLAGAHPEIATLARRYPDALRFTRGEATADAVSAALDGATLAHIAAHGRFRADNPMFSALDLADGPLTVHDLEALRRAPDTLVLSACDSGLSAVHPGDELLGLAASLFGLGTRTLVASLLPVSDKATRALMLAFHRHLQRGSTPAEALAAAQAKARATGDDAALAAAASFVCLGAG